MAVTTWSVKASSPPTFMEQSDGGHETSVGSHIEFIYQAILQSYDTKRQYIKSVSILRSVAIMRISTVIVSI